MPFENGAFGRNGRLNADRQVIEVEIDDPVDELEILDPHWSLTLFSLGSDQVVDAGAEVIQDEILLGRRLAVIDLLGPLLERQLDPERLVDGEGDIEEVEAVDAQVVDGVALGRDRVALDVAGLSNDVGHG